MMKKYKLSIIVAMYNIEKYIEHCLNSCVNQVGVSEYDYEVLVVNDGSTDSSAEKTSKFVSRYKNIRLLNKKNGGLSDARNFGLLNCTGEYVWFVDGDDAIAEDAVSLIIKNTSTMQDAYIINFSTFHQEGIILQSSHFNNLNSSISGSSYHHKTGRILPMMAWLTIYKVDFLRKNNLIFCQNILHEDLEFSVRAHHLSNGISMLSNNLYLYRVERPDSIMNQVNGNCLRSLKSYVKILDTFSVFFQKQLKTKFVQNLFSDCAVLYFMTYYRTCGYKNQDSRTFFDKTKFFMCRKLISSRKIKRLVFFIGLTFLPNIILCRFFRNKSVNFM